MNIVYVLWADNNNQSKLQGDRVFISILSVLEYVPNAKIYIYLSDRFRFSFYENFWANNNIHIIEMSERTYSGYFNKFQFFRKILDKLENFLFLDADMMFHKKLTHSKFSGFLQARLVFTHYIGKPGAHHNLHRMVPAQFSFLSTNFGVTKPYHYISSRIIIANQMNGKSFWCEYRKNMDDIIKEYYSHISPSDYTKRRNTELYADELYFTLGLVRSGVSVPKCIIPRHHLDRVMLHGIFRHKTKYMKKRWNKYTSSLREYARKNNKRDVEFIYKSVFKYNIRG